MHNKWIKTQTWMHQLGIFEEDLVEQFVQGSGPGGQKINKTASCVFLKHIPTNQTVKCQRSRSRELNRIYARMELCFLLEKATREKTQAISAEKARERQRNRKPSKAEKKRMRENKRHRSEKKSFRQKPKDN